MTYLERLGGARAVIDGIVSRFRFLSALPHPSWREAASARALAGWLEERGLSPVLDQWNNLCCDIPAAPGCAGAPLLILQGHLDMVCAVRPDSGWRPEADPVNIQVRDGWLRSDGNSSLGADNNLGNAAILWLLDQDLSHGPLRLICTTAEEVGLQGASKVDPAWLAGARYLLNTDGFKLGRLVVSSAGGRRETYTRPLERTVPRYSRAVSVALTGGTGGHSGEDIHLGRANPVWLMGELLSRLSVSAHWQLANLEGGTAHNAIPAACRANVVLPPEDTAVLERLLDTLSQAWRQEYGGTDPGLCLHWELSPMPDTVWAPACQEDTLALISSLAPGVYAPHPWVEGVTGASANLGRVHTEKGQIVISAFLRSAAADAMEAMAARHDAAARAAGFTGTYNSYPGWPGDRNSPLARTMETVAREVCGLPFHRTAVHVGLEPSVFHEKNPALDMVCAGPDILDAHSVDERAPLDTLPAYACLLAGTLEAVGRECP